ncbi:MAG: hypothetical protein KBD53_03635 [Candidatus Omnitrophica bacterium]|nr:hypothetical protein [Candidatus Omnitrophota bacterium]
MAKRYTLTLFSLFILIFGTLVIISPSPADNEVETSPHNELLLIQEDPERNRFFALEKKEGSYGYVQYDGQLNSVFTITILGPKDLNPTVSAIDTNGRYFFTTTSGRQTILYILALETGETINEITLDYTIDAMEYDPSSDTIVGFAQDKNFNSHVVRIDLKLGSLSSLIDLSRDYSLDFKTFFFNEQGQEIWITGSNVRNTYMLEISTVTGSINILRMINIKPENQTVYDFNIMKTADILFSAARKDSIYITGFNERLKTAFILHLTDKSTKIKDRVGEIHKQLLEYSGGGISDYEIKIISTVDSDEAMILEKNLKEAYGLNQIERKEFFTLKSNSIVISADGVSIY